MTIDEANRGITPPDAARRRAPPCRLCGILTRPASAAEFNYKLATGQDPTHPVNIRAQEAIDRIREATDGRLEIKLFPANQLGSDTDLLAQVRNGGVEFFNLSSSILATFVPVAGHRQHRLRLPGLRRRVEGDGRRARRPTSAPQIAKTPILTVSQASGTTASARSPPRRARSRRRRT